MSSYAFPSKFVWGTATAAYQVEGAIDQDGRGPSIWDTYCNSRDNIIDGSSGQIACDQYHRYHEDILLMKDLGVNAYRMSIAWSRIFPDDTGRVNPKGIAHYLRVLEDLREHDIKPFVTLYHWDLPQWLQDSGGWVNRDTAYRFADYTRELVSHFQELVDTWITLNEPWCAAYLGYGAGNHAPGVADQRKALIAIHHLNLAHGLASQEIRAELGDSARISVALNLQVTNARTDSPKDLWAKHRAELMGNEVFLGPMFEGSYDPEIFEVTKNLTDWSFVKDGDCAIIHQKIQSLGLNYYSSNTVRYRETNADSSDADEIYGNPMPAQEHVETLRPDGELTAMGWGQNPQDLSRILVELSKRYPEMNLMVTENGSAWQDEVTNDSLGSVTVKHVHDQRRVHYLSEHVRALSQALQQDAHVTGYFAWSLLDNFEWALGYTKRFGLFYVDYSTQERIWKDSALWYQGFLKSKAIIDN